MSNVSCRWMLNFGPSFVRAGMRSLMNVHPGFAQRCCLVQRGANHPFLAAASLHRGAAGGLCCSPWLSLASK